MWSSTEITVYRRAARSGSGNHVTSPAVAVVNPCFACSSSSGMAMATPRRRVRRATSVRTTPCQYTGAARSTSDAFSCFWCVGAIGMGERSIARTSQCEHARPFEQHRLVDRLLDRRRGDDDAVTHEQRHRRVADVLGELGSEGGLVDLAVVVVDEHQLVGEDGASSGARGSAARPIAASADA